MDVDTPNAPMPLEFATAVGPRRPLLLRFGSLDAVVPRSAMISGVKLHLFSADGAPIEIASIRRVVTPWKSAGPSVLTGRIRAATETQTAEEKGLGGRERKASIAETRTAATWRSAEAGRSWGRPGALGETDSIPIEGATFASDATGVTVAGLEGTVQSMTERWWENGGFLITFKIACDDRLLALSQRATRA